MPQHHLRQVHTQFSGEQQGMPDLIAVRRMAKSVRQAAKSHTMPEGPWH